MPGRIMMYVDGGILGPRNPSEEGVYWSVGIERPTGFVIVTERKENRNYHTNNDAEYLAVLDGLCWLLERHRRKPIKVPITIHSDSQLIVNQISGKFKCWNRDSTLFMLLGETRQMLRFLRKTQRLRIKIKWVSRRETSRRLGH